MKSGLASDVERLLAEQSGTWPLLGRGLEGLRASRTRAERVAGRELLVRHIPHRMISTTARVDPLSIAQRPCFLCAANMPAEERGIPFDADWTIYCNPFPILDRHLTIVHAQHRPQRIAGNIDVLLRLAQALPDAFVIYNGPECGASAPDHLHLQACSRALFPIGRDIAGVEGACIPDYARRVFLLRDGDAARMTRRLDRLLNVLRPLLPGSDEPLVNIAAFYDGGRWTALVFPRSKHRPRVYETGEFTVSPATIDLCGVLVVPVAGDFGRIAGADIERIFAEVTMPAETFGAALSRMEVEA